MGKARDTEALNVVIRDGRQSAKHGRQISIEYRAVSIGRHSQPMNNATCELSQIEGI